MTDRSKPLPLWLRLVLSLASIALAVGLFDKRGMIAGVVAAVVFGLLAPACLLAWEHITAWSKRHPVLDSWIIFPLLWAPVVFLEVVYQTKLPIVICMLIALLLVAGLLLVGLGLRRRRARQRNGL